MDADELSREGRTMLVRLIKKGSFRLFNDALAEELIGRGYAELRGEALLPTERAREVFPTRELTPA